MCNRADHCIELFRDQSRSSFCMSLQLSKCLYAGKRAISRINEGVLSGIYKDYVVTNTHTYRLTTVTLCLCVWVNEYKLCIDVQVVLEEIQ